MNEGAHDSKDLIHGIASVGTGLVPRNVVGKLLESLAEEVATSNDLLHGVGVVTKLGEVVWCSKEVAGLFNICSNKQLAWQDK